MWDTHGVSIATDESQHYFTADAIKSTNTPIYTILTTSPLLLLSIALVRDGASTFLTQPMLPLDQMTTQPLNDRHLKHSTNVSSNYTYGKHPYSRTNPRGTTATSPAHPRHPHTFEVASDGGAREDLGSFGWNIAVRQETLWHCKGPTFGLLPGSFRAESYGMLSVLLFIDTYFKHYNTRLDTHTTLKFYCDNSSLLKRITRNQKWSWINPTTCLAPDFDLESGIIAILIDLPITLQFIHVKGHQKKPPRQPHRSTPTHLGCADECASQPPGYQLPGKLLRTIQDNSIHPPFPSKPQHRWRNNHSKICETITTSNQ